jgi:MYXO-CTERM domain-containing protein
VMYANRLRSMIMIIMALGVLTPGVAAAGNGAHPRTPVDWTDAPCMTIIDRSQDPIHALSYAIPFEDTDVTPDEVVDSRTHQFFGFCRDRHLEDILPGWITEANVIAAGANGLGDPSIVDLELEVLENAPDWAGCWTRITNDDERRPITFAAAAEPVMWDTSTLAAGTWSVDGYTYEPWFNLWSPHPGVFKIVDDPDPAASPPAAALTFFEQTVSINEEASITGCVDAMPGSTMRLSWSNGNINGEPNWEVFSADIPAARGSFDLPFAPPLAAASNSVMIRLEIVDPIGRAWTAYSREYIAVVDEVGETGCDDGGSFVSNPCDDGGSGSESGLESGDSGTDSSDSNGSTGPSFSDDGNDAGGCSCSTPGPSGLGMLGMISMIGLAFVGRVRRTKWR